MSKPQNFPETFLQNPSLPSKQGKFPSYPQTTPNQKSTQKGMGQPMQKSPEGGHDFMDSTTVTHSSLLTEPLRQNAQDMKSVIQHLVLENFKLKACSFNIQHNHKSCPFYHNCKDKKRPGNFYSADICEYAEREETCPNGDLCQKSHNRVEQLYRPDKYKTKFCSFYPNYLEKCEYGVFCSFAHNENDILVELIHNLVYDDDFFMFKYKTVWCPFNLTQHDKSLCVYAHNWQDYRRSPHLFHYEPNPCPNWKSNDFVINYNEGCSNNFSCTKCHGWKEHEFHPLNYKIKLCPAGRNCTKGRDCSYYHNEVDRRVLSQEIAYNVFKYFPKNRIITNTFKTLINEFSSVTTNNEGSGEIVLTNVNNPWEKRDMTYINDNIHSLTDSNLMNLYDNVERRESNEQGNESGKIKPSFSLTNLDKYMMQNNQKMKPEDPPNVMFQRQEIVYPNETWNQKKPSVQQQPSKYMMAFSQPLFESNTSHIMNLDDNEPQMPSNLNRSFNQTPSQNPNNFKSTNPSMSFGIAAPPNLKKINPTMNPPRHMISKSQLNNTPNVMNQINQVRSNQQLSLSMGQPINQLMNQQMNQPNMTVNQPNLNMNQPNMNMNQPNMNMNQPNMNINQPNMNLNQPNMNLNQPNMNLNQTNMGQPNMNQQNMNQQNMNQPMNQQIPMKQNQGSLTFNENFATSMGSMGSMKYVKSANFPQNTYSIESTQQIQMSFPQMKPTSQKLQRAQQQMQPNTFLPQSSRSIQQNMMFYNNMMNDAPMESQQRYSMSNTNVNTINRKETEKPHFNLNINSQPFTVSYSFNCVPNSGTEQPKGETAENFEKKNQNSKLGIWTNTESNNMNKVCSQANLHHNFGSAEFDFEEKRAKSTSDSPLMGHQEQTPAEMKSNQLDTELESKLTLERENEKHSEAQINNILKNICEEEYEDKN